MCRFTVSVRRRPRSWYDRLTPEAHSTRCSQRLRSGELGGQKEGGIKSFMRWRLNLTLQISQGSASTYFRWSGHFRHSFKGFFRDNPSNFYCNRFIFDRQAAKNKLAQFFLHGVVLLLSLVLVIKKSTCIPFISFAAFKESVTLNLAQRSYNLAAIEGPYSLQRH